MATAAPITQQVRSSDPPTLETVINSDLNISELDDCLIFNRNGACLTFKSLYQNQKAIIVFVRVR